MYMVVEAPLQLSSENSISAELPSAVKLTVAPPFFLRGGMGGGTGRSPSGFSGGIGGSGEAAAGSLRPQH